MSPVWRKVNPMSMHPHAIGSIPDETIRVARAAFPRGNMYLSMRDQLGTLYEDQNFAALFPKRGRPAEAPWQLALVQACQFLLECLIQQFVPMMAQKHKQFGSSYPFHNLFLLL